MLITGYDDAQDSRRPGQEASAQPGGEGDWFDPAGNPPLSADRGNTLGGWL